MNRMKNIGLILCGLVLGLTLSSPAARAVGSLKVTLSTNRILVDGKEVRLTAYNINGNNYVMLRDVGKTVGFEVYWDGDTKCVQIESDKPYTGEAPVKAGTSEPASQPEVTTPADEVAVAKQDIVDRTNALRRAKGVAALRVNDKLTQAAQVRADEIAASASTPTPARMGARATPSPTANTPAKTFTTSRSCILSSSTKRSLKRWSSCGPTPRPMRTT